VKKARQKRYLQLTLKKNNVRHDHKRKGQEIFLRKKARQKRYLQLTLKKNNVRHDHKRKGQEIFL